MWREHTGRSASDKSAGARILLWRFVIRMQLLAAEAYAVSSLCGSVNSVRVPVHCSLRSEINYLSTSRVTSFPASWESLKFSCVYQSFARDVKCCVTLSRILDACLLANCRSLT